MLPKRKFIKKQFTAVESTQTQEHMDHQSTGDLIDQLKSQDNKMKADAISAIANLLILDNEFEDELFSASTLIELIKVLGSGTQNVMTQTAIFAINNLCQNETESNPISKTVKNLFNLGLDKALTELDSTDSNLIKPILILMGNIVEYIPKQYRYLVDGIQYTLINGYEKYLSTEKYYDLVLEFLLKSKFEFQSKDYTPEQLKVLQVIRNISQMDKFYRNRAMASNLLLNMTQGNSQETVQNFCINLEEFMCDIDLQKEYKSNFQSQNEQKQDQFSKEEDIREDEIEENVMMEEEVKSKNKVGKGKNNKGQEIQNTNCKEIQQNSPYNLFMDALQGIQILFEYIIEQFEDQNNFNDENDDEEMEQEQQVQEQIKSEFNKQILFQKLGESLCRNFCLLQKFAGLTFIEGQNIIELVLRLLLSFPKQFVGHDKIPCLSLIRLAEYIIIHEFKLQMNNFVSIPEQILIYNTKTVFEVILKFKQMENREIYLQLPFLVYGNTAIMKVNNQWKQCWIDLLEIYSLFYNPEKVKDVSEKQNREIGKVLKQLIVSIPEIQLQQWRAQTIDTVFDIYSNESFDKIFMEYGFIDVLQHVLKTVGSGNKIGNKKNKKSNKFINDVVTDIQRFLAYKKKMIGL